MLSEAHGCLQHHFLFKSVSSENQSQVETQESQSEVFCPEKNPSDTGDIHWSPERELQVVVIGYHLEKEPLE